MDLNEIKIKLSGVANLPKELKLGKEYDLTISQAEVRKSEDVPNDDNTINRIFKVSLSEFSEVNIISEKDVIRAVKKKWTQSQVLRRVIENKWESEGMVGDREEFYGREMSAIIDRYISENDLIR